MEGLPKLAFCVPPISEGFDPNSEPMNGEEFLQRMCFERKKCPEIVSVKNPGANKNYTVQPEFLENEKLIQDDTSKSLLATKEWQQMQITEFRKIRKKVIEMRQKYQETGSSTNLNLSNICRSSRWENYCRENSPLLATMMKIDQPLLESLLEQQSEWLSDRLDEETIIDFSGDGKWLSQWIYAGLACLHIPLEPNVHNIIRKIARICKRIRTSLGPDDEIKVMPLNLIICIIANNFSQLDLKDQV